ncbi:MAG: GNAT family N-acetyltransferase [Bacteroidetes bacterium]|nr:MAG: GNAT family N-acetyltransferase [Bacteroidota bacterium]
MSKILIRKGLLSDLDTLVGFMISMAKETENLDLEDTILRPGIKAALQDEQKGIYYIAEIDGQIAGSLMTTFEWSDWRNKWVLWVQSVYTHPDFRGKGVYKALYENLMQKVDKGEYAGIRLYVDKTNVSAQKVYERLGMDGSHYYFYEWMKS